MPFAVAAAVAALFATPSPAVRYAVAAPNVGWVHARPDGVGTGWLADADRRLLVTCRHVVGDQKKVEVFFPDGRAEKSAYLGNRADLRAAGRLIDGTVVHKSDAADLAVVRLDALPPAARGLPLAAADPFPGDAVFAVGNRGDLDTCWNLTTGHVRQTGRLTDGYPWRGLKLATAAGAVLLQLPIAEGDSGGPVLDSRGVVVAVVTAIRTRAPLATVGVSAGEVRKVLAAVREGEAPAEPIRRPPETPFAALAAGTVWVRPTATEAKTAGVLVDRDRRLVVTSHAGVGPSDRVAVLFPVRANGRIVGERDAYTDAVGLRLGGAWRTGTVVGRDPVRDLAVIRLDGVPAGASAIPLAAAEPAIGDAVHTISHPAGTEFAWCYAAGVVRQRGRTPVGPARDDDPKPLATVLQLPAQGASAGGPVANDRGELVGILAVREGVQQQVGYAAALGELRAFLADQPARDASRVADRVRTNCRLPRFLAVAWAAEADRLQAAGKPDDAAAACDTALSLDPGCGPARVVRGHLRLAAGDADAAAADFDRVLAADPENRPAAWARADIALRRNDPKRAAAELARLLDPDPADAVTHRKLADALVAAGDDARSDSAFTNAVRLDPGQLRAIGADLVGVADESLRRAPDAPGRVADALARGLSAATRGLPPGPDRAKREAAIRRAAAIPDEKQRLAALRELVK